MDRGCSVCKRFAVFLVDFEGDHDHVEFGSLFSGL